MLLSHEDDEGDMHPYCYARVVAIFHIDVKFHDPAETLPPIAKRMDVLWVRWFDYDSTYTAGWQARRLHRLQFVETDSHYEQFGFVDPSDVIQGVHIIPAFARGTTSRFLGPSVARSFKEENIENDHDYNFYYVNMWVPSLFHGFHMLMLVSRFVDCDIFVRFLGGGIGHMATNLYTAGLRPTYHDNATSNEVNNEEDQPEDENMPAYEGSDLEDGDGSGSDAGNTSDEDGWQDYNGEDGEEPWDADDTDTLGFAEF